MTELDFSGINAHYYEWSALNYIEFEISIGLDSFKTLVSNQEASLALTKKKFQDILDNDMDLKTFEDSLKGNYYSAYYESEEIAIKELQKQQRYSICLSVFSFFEGRLKQLCNLIEHEYDYKIKINDLSKGNDIMRYMNYLEKVFEMESEELKQLLIL